MIKSISSSMNGNFILKKYRSYYLNNLYSVIHFIEVNINILTY